MRSWLAAMVLLGAVCTAQEHGGSVSGTVVDITDAVIPNARIILSGPTNRDVRTDRIGEFGFLGLEPGTYKLKFESPGFKSKEVTMTVEAGKELSFGHLRLDVAPVRGCESPPPKVNLVRQKLVSTNAARISGIVRDGNRPVSGARIALHQSGERYAEERHEIALAVTDMRGAFKIEALVAGVYDLQMDAPCCGLTVVYGIKLSRGFEVKLNPVQMAPAVLCL